jgi:glutathione synthase/RimK-type ligase-like ATP-grasp enzyme
MKMDKKIISFGICFSKDFEGNDPLGHIGVKKPVYLRLLELCGKEGWNVYVLTRKTYKDDGIFEGSWKFNDGKFDIVATPVKLDLVYDRSAGVKFPPLNDKSVVWVNNLDFKILAWDKWATSKLIGQFMPQTFLLENESEIQNVLPKIKTDWVVLKPFDGLMGVGIFIGSKSEALDFKFNKKYNRYVAQEFIDTSGGIPGIAKGKHDLRIVIINGKAVWCHVREPVGASFLANAAQGGNLTEIDYAKVPDTVKQIVGKISKIFYSKYDNPVYSLDFGIDKDGTPKIFEINDQIGFPKWEMKNRDNFLTELISNFRQKLSRLRYIGNTSILK